MRLANLKSDLKKLANPQKAQVLQHFFKTGPDQYGEGDMFLGITVPLHQKQSLRRNFRNRGDITWRQTRPNPQSCGLDVKTNRQARRKNACFLPKQALQTNAPHRFALCPRTLRRQNQTQVPRLTF